MKKLLPLLAVAVLCFGAGCDALKPSDKKKGSIDLGKSDQREKKGEVKGIPSGPGGGVVTDDGLH